MPKAQEKDARESGGCPVQWGLINAHGFWLHSFKFLGIITLLEDDLRMHFRERLHSPSVRGSMGRRSSK